MIRPQTYDLFISAVARDGRSAAGTVLRGSAGTTLRVTSRGFGAIPRVQASYRTLLRALWHARSVGARRLRVYTDDAELVAELDGQVDVPAEHIGLHLQVRAMLNAYRWSSVQLIPRQQNSEAALAAADALERQAVAGAEADEVETLPLWLSSELTATGMGRVAR
ncbi:MAG TPA: reverse transcriptase-like protein [bacterium]